MRNPLHIVLEITRARAAPEPTGYPLAAQEYQLRHADGTVDAAVFPWSEALRADLLTLGKRADPHVEGRVGKALQAFFTRLGWRRYETQIREAVRERRPVHLVIRSQAVELCALPLDLLMVEPEGLAFGRMPLCQLSYAWPGKEAATPEPGPAGGQILFAWSAAGGVVPFHQHLAELRRGGVKEPVLEVVPEVTLETLSKALEAAKARGRGVAVLHLLCHGARLPGQPEAYGLWLGSSRHPEDAVPVDPVSIESCLAPYAGLLRSVVLFACEGGNTGGEDNLLGSVAQRLHRVGVPAVVASRFPLTVAGSTAFTAGFYGALGRGESLHQAIAAGRRRLAEDVKSLDWMGLQIWARTSEDLDCRPLEVPGAPPAVARRVMLLAGGLLAAVLVAFGLGGVDREGAPTQGPEKQTVAQAAGGEDAGRTQRADAGTPAATPSGGNATQRVQTDGDSKVKVKGMKIRGQYQNSTQILDAKGNSSLEVGTVTIDNSPPPPPAPPARSPQ